MIQSMITVITWGNDKEAFICKGEQERESMHIQTLCDEQSSLWVNTLLTNPFPHHVTMTA